MPSDMAQLWPVVALAMLVGPVGGAAPANFSCAVSVAAFEFAQASHSSSLPVDPSAPLPSIRLHDRHVHAITADINWLLARC